ncbi:MAG: phenylacetate--CoA ligase family protein, partial [Christensenellales bacterium]
KKLDDAGVRPEDIKSLEDIRLLPFTVKDDLRDNYPFGMFAVPMRDVVRVHASSGTTGKATVVGYTKNDLAMWAEAVARMAVAGGASCDDIAQISFGYGLFTGALGLHYGLERLGATVIPVSAGNTERQITLMRDFGTTLLVATPSYAMYLAETAERMGVLGDLKVRIGLVGAEGSTNELRNKIAEKFGAVVTENYGLSEVIGPGVAGECVYHTGMHICEDLFYIEILNPETGEPVQEGETGEVVITPLMKEALPILRYRTHDLSRFLPGECPCGRTTRRLAQLTGRTDDMLIIRGVNVFPSQIEGVLLTIKGIGPHYEIIVTREDYLDRLEVVVELLDSSLLEKWSELEALQQKIQHELRVVLQIDAKVTLVSPNTLRRFEGKARRVKDLR